MHNGRYIAAGLAVFVAIVAFPFVYNIGSKAKTPEPSIDTPVINRMDEKKCVESKEFMRANHMQLLDEWRDAAVRDGNRVYVNTEGKEFEISLQNTCMRCHSNKKKFCDECHNYLAVRPYCWDCHLTPGEGWEGGGGL